MAAPKIGTTFVAVDGHFLPARVFQKVAGAWKRVVLYGNPPVITIVANAIAITNPTPGQNITGSSFTLRAVSVNAAAVSFLLDGVTDLGEVQYNGEAWVLTSRPTLDIPNGAHTVVAAATYKDGATGTATVSVTFATSGVADPGGTGTINELIVVTKPDQTLTTPTVAGDQYQFEVTIDPSLGVPSAVDFAVGSVADKGYLPASKISATGWRLTSTFNTLTYEASLADAGNSATLQAQTLADIWFDIQARVTFPNGTILFSPYVRALGRNKTPEFVGTEPVWNANKAWAADATSMSTFVHSYDKVQNQGTYQVTGNTYGKELGATTTVDDPDATNSYGHLNHGRCILIDVPNDYAAQTAGTKNSYTGGTYPSTGDQASSGGLRGQYSTPCRFVEGELAYYSQSMRINPQFGTPGPSHVSCLQIYGPANNGDYDWGLFLMLDAQQKTTEHGDTIADTWQIWGNRFNKFERQKLFSMPFYRGKWVDFVIGVGFSKDARKGWIEIYTAQPGINGGALTQHVFPNGETRLHLVTLPELSDGTPFHTHLYRAKDKWPTPNIISAHFAKMKVGPTAASVNPHSYV